MLEKKTERWPAGPTELERRENELIIEIEAERLKDFHNHPFRIKEDIEMKDLMESIGRFGILSPLVVRPLPEGKYEIVSGHRRKYAALMLGYRKLPVIIRVMDDDEAVISMVEANIHRETILPTEKAFAIKMKYDAMKRTEGKTKRSQNDHRPKGVRTVQLLGEETGDSAKQIQRYLKITELIPELRDLLDAARISFNPAYELAFLDEKDQKKVFQAIMEVNSPPSLSQAQRIRKLGTDRILSVRIVKDILSEVKKGDIHRVVFKNEQLYQFFPRNYPPKKMKQDILTILKRWTDENGKLAQNWQVHFSQNNTSGEEKNHNEEGRTNKDV